MEIALVHCPAWITDCPPYASASLAANLRKAGYKVRCHDLNIEFFRLTEREGVEGKTKINSESWIENNIRDWENINYVRDYIIAHSDEIDRCIDGILSVPVKIAGFTMYNVSAYFSYEIASRIKKRDPGIIIVFGGPACFINAREIKILKECPGVDIICYGEAEEAIVKLAGCIEENKDYTQLDGFAFRLPCGALDPGRDMPRIMDFENLPFADFSDFNLELYTRKLLPMNSCRGCVNRCTFCNESPYWGKYRSRSAKRVYDEICFQLEKYPMIDAIWFIDSLINGNMKIMSEMCDYFIASPRKFIWDASALIRKEMTDDILLKMKASGCNSLHYGLESGSNHVLKLMNKGYSRELAITVLLRTLNADINVNVNLIVGFPGETVMDFMETIDLIRILKKSEKFTYHPPVNTCMIAKGSYLFFNYLKYNIISNEPDKWITENRSNTPSIRKSRKDLALQFIDTIGEKHKWAVINDSFRFVKIIFIATTKQMYFQYLKGAVNRFIINILLSQARPQRILIGKTTIRLFIVLKIKYLFKAFIIKFLFLDFRLKRKIKRIVNRSTGLQASEKRIRYKHLITKIRRIASMLPEDFNSSQLYALLLMAMDEKHFIPDLETFSEKELAQRAVSLMNNFYKRDNK